MKIAVCLKQVPSTETRITVGPQTRRVDLKNVEWVISPYDEYALEEALRIREKLTGTVTAFSFGPERVKNALKTALATGADAACWISDEGLTEPDGFVTAKALAAALTEQGPGGRGAEGSSAPEPQNPRTPESLNPAFDLILCGNKAVDDDMGYVGIALAVFLDLPHVSSVTKLEIADDRKSARVHREIEGATEIITTSLPAVFTAQKGLNEPRYPTLRGMMLAGKKEIPTLKLADLGLTAENLKPRAQVLDAVLPPERKAGRIIEAPTREEAVHELVRALREEAKVI
jgi:electron transfer flavoprotein beta subunit